MVSQKAWNFLFLCSLFLIPALSIFGRELQSAVSKNNLIEIAEYVIGAALIATAFLVVAARRSGPVNWQLMLFAIVVFVMAPYQLERYEERLHFICFGLLGLTAYRSFGLRVAVVLTCSAGVGDEVLQHFLPSRVGHWRDVVMNCFAGLSAILLVHKAG